MPRQFGASDPMGSDLVFALLRQISCGSTRDKAVCCSSYETPNYVAVFTMPQWSQCHNLHCKVGIAAFSASVLVELL